MSFIKSIIHYRHYCHKSTYDSHRQAFYIDILLYLNIAINECHKSTQGAKHFVIKYLNLSPVLSASSWSVHGRPMAANARNMPREWPSPITRANIPSRAMVWIRSLLPDTSMPTVNALLSVTCVVRASITFLYGKPKWTKLILMHLVVLLSFSNIPIWMTGFSTYVNQ